LFTEKGSKIYLN